MHVVSVLPPFDGRLGAEVKFNPISSKDQGRVHPFGIKVFRGLVMGYVLNEERCWIGDFLILDAEDLEAMPPSELSELHIKRFKSKRGGHKQ